MQRRFRTTASADVSKIVSHLRETRTFKNNWLRDSSTYPLLAALGCAITMCVGVGLSCLANNPDVRLTTEKKHATIRNWGL